ncbi:cytochrome c biogenesis protein ResB [Chitinivorax sp. PXF-14]|uniref:cytochrome c biogenesis protein ResB n=1 Tax=Chitinivorax sp. PXF-14 TaxID=3230488 RepID=UPI00346648B9
MRRTTFTRALYDLLSSMRFAVTLLTVIAMASVIGTVLKQNEPYPSYAIEFGQYWFKIFEWLGLFDVYHSVWFLTILLFLVVSTSLCIYRNLPGMLRDMRSFREHASERSLRAFSHQGEFVSALPMPMLVDHLTAYLSAKGYRAKVNAHQSGDVLIAAKAGSLQKLGYFFAHSAVVMICIGGLLDGNVPFKLQQMLGWKQAETRDVPQSQIPAKSRLSAGNLSFRGNVTVPTGGDADVIFINVGDGYMVQELPFVLTLKQFHIEHYSTGQPKLFASDIEVTDKATGEKVAATVKVNHPLVFKGAAIYQASFGDGGSKLELAQWDLLGKGVNAKPFTARSQMSVPFPVGGKPFTLEFGDFRLFNIENFGSADKAASGTKGVMQNAMQVTSEKNLHNIGPSITFKLRDAQGQAIEYQNYMQPVQIDGGRYFLSGMRGAPNEPFQYLRIPADEEGSLAGYMRLKSLLTDKAGFKHLVDVATKSAMKDQHVSDAYRAQFRQSAEWVLERFSSGGFNALDSFLKARVPADKREMVARTYLRILQGVAVEAWQLSRKDAGLAPVEVTPERFRFVVDSLVALSTSFDYGAPIYLQMTGFDEVKASGFQITRAPGKNIVYLGSILLVLGVFAMFYIRERRVFFLVKSGGVLLAMSANRKQAEFEREFAQVKTDIHAVVSNRAVEG